MTNVPVFQIDGSWIDIWTMICAAIYAVFRVLLKRCRSLPGFVAELSHGASIFPLLMLATAAFWSKGVEALLNGNKVVMTFAGLMGLVVIVGRSFEETDSNKRNRW